MRKFAISDIHGNVKTFKALLRKINFTKEDQLYLLGDFIDRGPDSKAVIDEILSLQKQGYQLDCLIGNHEDALLGSRTDQEKYQNWLHWGGRETLQSFGASHWREIPGKYWDFMESLVTYFEVDHYILVHAGLNFDTPNPMDNKYSMMWIRNWYEDINYAWLGDRIIVHGHTPVEQMTILKMHQKIEAQQYIDIDNGCFVDFKPGMGQLCAFELGTHQLTFQKNIE